KGKGEVNGAKTNSKERPLFLVNGIATSEEAVSKINPNEIKSINVIKDKEALKIYGDKAKHGVVAIITHKRVS
ncbi:TonB-dependent receptor plug domain-containing protein, partial [bacterium]|nr:TonB-dependent receptor plug domain-containing protein [bacterium]